MLWGFSGLGLIGRAEFDRFGLVFFVGASGLIGHGLLAVTV